MSIISGTLPLFMYVYAYSKGLITPRTKFHSYYEAFIFWNNPYSALSDGAFRVIILLKGKPEDPIVCRLNHVSPTDNVKYVALSYAWGEQNSGSSELIVCNGSAFWIQPNLASAMRTLRLRNEDRTIWADAICINQNDPKEKARQVPIMRDIYAGARQVIVWLGEERRADKRAFNFLKWLSGYFDQMDNHLQGDLPKTGSELAWEQIKREDSQNFEALVKLLNRDWFMRTWVLQELASAQSAILVCGSESIPWDDVSDVIRKLRDPLYMVNHMENSKTQAALKSILAMESARRSVNGTFPLSLFEILLATCSNNCTDPRDKIYAVLGLAKDWLEKGGLDPDYEPTTSAEKVFKNLAMWDVKKNGQIRILSCAAGPDTASNLPSWAPDWRKLKNTQPFVLYSGSTLFSASADLPVEAWYSDHGNTLHAMGEVVDSVNTVGSPPLFCKVASISAPTEIEEDAFRLAGLGSWLSECHYLAADLGVDLDGGRRLSESRYQQFWRTMTCGLTGDAFPVSDEYGGYFKAYWAHIRSELKSLKSDVRSTIPDIEDADIEDDDGTKQVNHDRIEVHDPKFSTHALIESSLEKWSSKRRFCRTSKGNLACVPPGTREGDLICILYGGEVPYVLRPLRAGSTDLYAVIGECYVDGIMHGEALSRGISRLRHFKLV